MRCGEMNDENCHNVIWGQTVNSIFFFQKKSMSLDHLLFRIG